MGFIIFLLIVAAIITIIVVIKKANLKKAQEESTQELKKSDNYAFIFEIKKMLENMGKGCDFGEPYIGFNYNYKHQANASFSSYINIPSEYDKSLIRIHTSLYKYEHEKTMDYLIRSSTYTNKGCVLDMGGTIVSSDKDSPELIDTVFKTLFCFASGCNMYVKGKLTSQPSEILPDYTITL